MNIRLNLIPEYRKVEIRESQSFRFAIIIGLEIAVLMLFVWISLFSFQKIVDFDLSLAKKNIDFDDKKNNFDKIAEYDKEFESSNVYLAELEKIQKDSLNWSLFFRKLDQIVPPEISLNGLVTRNFKVMLSGTAKSREILVSFKEKMDKEECMNNVDLPLSNLVSRNNVDFQIDFLLDEKCIKK